MQLWMDRLFYSNSRGYGSWCLHQRTTWCTRWSHYPSCLSLKRISYLQEVKSWKLGCSAQAYPCPQPERSIHAHDDEPIYANQSGRCQDRAECSPSTCKILLFRLRQYRSSFATNFDSRSTLKYRVLTIWIGCYDQSVDKRRIVWIPPSLGRTDMLLLLPRLFGSFHMVLI